MPGSGIFGFELDWPELAHDAKTTAATTRRERRFTGADSKSGRDFALDKRVTSLEIDRVTPTLEPDATVVMHQNWHQLLSLHWDVPAEELQKFVTPALTIDTH